MDECLDYFRRAVTDPLSVPPWSEWWATHEGLVERAFPRREFIRFKHRRLTGARRYLVDIGELGADRPAGSLLSGSCFGCGERTTTCSGHFTCPRCSWIGGYNYNFGPAPNSTGGRQC